MHIEESNNMDNIFCFRVTISFLQNVCAFRLVPMLFTTLVVFSWVDSSQVCFSKCSILSATLYMLVIRVYFIYRVFFPWTKKKLYIAIRVSPPLTLLDSFTLQYLPSFPCAWCCWWVESSPRQHLLWWCSVPREHQATYKPVITLHWLPSRLWANFCSLCRWDLSLMP